MTLQHEHLADARVDMKAEEGKRPDPRAVLVTGAAGHVGANLVRALLAQGRRVRALVRRRTQAIEGLAVETVRGDLLDGDSLRAACSGTATVFHLAAVVSAGWEPSACMGEVNVRGTANLIEACLASGVRRFLHFSSIQALAPRPGDEFVDHASALVERNDHRRGPYDVSKAEGERLVLASVARGLDATILNPTAVVGPYDFQPSPMGEVLRALGRGTLPALVAGGHCDFVDARDVAGAALAAEERGRSGQRYLIFGTRLSLSELAERWAAATGKAAPRLAFPMAVVRLAAPFASAYARLRRRRPLLTAESLRILRTQPPVRCRRAEADLGYHPRPIEETLRDTCEWMKQQGWV
jgi:dihydroflavonol-4-reductase